MRYMGTKRGLASLVRSIVLELYDGGSVADLFAGMGSVSIALSPDVPVIANDALRFTTAFANTHLVQGSNSTAIATSAFHRRFIAARGFLSRRFSRRLSHERLVLGRRRRDLRLLMESSPHTGNSRWYNHRSQVAQRSQGVSAYQLATLYFAGGYFSTRQAIDLDALRFAIDRCGDGNRDALLASWLAAAAAIMNGPGHCAQYLKPTTRSVEQRIRAQWGRDVWSEFSAISAAVQSSNATRRNLVTQMDALAFLKSGAANRLGIVYADPPYTRHEYSRYYHVYETLYRYDYPDSRGTGRYRSDRFRSDFSKASSVGWAFNEMASRVASLGVPLVLSYPEDGLLCRRGLRPDTILRHHFREVSSIKVATKHSTLAGSAVVSGSNAKATVEWLFIARA